MNGNVTGVKMYCIWQVTSIELLEGDDRSVRFDSIQRNRSSFSKMVMVMANTLKTKHDFLNWKKNIQCQTLIILV